MDKHYIAILAHEFLAVEGSFLYQLRIGMHWDKGGLTSDLSQFALKKSI